MKNPKEEKLRKKMKSIQKAKDLLYDKVFEENRLMNDEELELIEQLKKRYNNYAEILEIFYREKEKPFKPKLKLH